MWKETHLEKNVFLRDRTKDRNKKNVQNKETSVSHFYGNQKLNILVIMSETVKPFLSDKAVSKGKITFVENEKIIHSLTHILPMLHFCTSWKRQKTFDFLTFSGGYRNVILGEYGLIQFFNTFFFNIVSNLDFAE